MNVLSLFNGMGCAEIALIESRIKYNKMYTSEIDKFALIQTRHNFPNNIELGDVRYINTSKIEKIDLLVGGSPCQSFSFAGKRKGMSTKDEQEILTLDHYLQLKEEGFEFEGQSYLFWEFIRILNEVKPKYFLLENVSMSEKWAKVLSKAIGVNGIHIDSKLVSAQNRHRVYWTNIGLKPSGLFNHLYSIIEQPKDRGISLSEILENHEFRQIPKCFYGNFGKKQRINDLNWVNNKKSNCLTTSSGHPIQYILNHDKTLCRNLSISEYNKLQTIPLWYEWVVSKTQQYKMLGNGWTIEVIKHIFSYI